MAITVSVISSMATKQILNELAALCNDAGRPVCVDSVGGVDAARRIRNGETFDVVVLAADAIQTLSNEGFLTPDSIEIFARSPTALALPAGVPLPAQCDEATVRALVSGAKRIGLSTGPSGKNIAQLLQAWDATEQLHSRIVLAPPGVPVARLISSGAADVGFQQLSELLGEPGIQIAGTLPPSLQPMTVFTCAIARNTANVASASAVIATFVSVTAAAIKRRGGMEPAA
jgi:molybdate transport system substrate-binding protein